VLLVIAGDNPQRIGTEAQWAMLCGIAPIPATSGLIDGRYLLNSGGDRHANNAIWRIVITRFGQHEPRTGNKHLTNIGASICSGRRRSLCGDRGPLP